MKDFEFRGTKVESVEFINKLPHSIKTELNNKYSYNVGYSKMNTCTGEFRAEIYDKNSPDTFHLTVVIKGFFTTSPDADKARLHVGTYNALFPYVSSFISTLTVNSGIPPINIPFVDIEGQNIYRVEMPEIRKDNEDKND